MSTTKQLNTLPQKFCVAPFLQITTHPSTSFSPCPYLGGTTWTKSYPSIKESWNSDELEGLRQSFLNNQQSPICGRCWDEESHNKRSLRLRLLDPETLHSEYKILEDPKIVDSMIESIKDQSYKKGPKLLSIKNGNVCNAKCRTCHPEDSSRWIADSKKLYELHDIKTAYKLNVKEVNWSDSQIEEIFELSEHLVRLELFGGEPTYNKKVIALLNRIVESGRSKNISLYINTNGSVNIVEKIPRLDQFKEIDIGVSIDGVGKQFEYIRHGVEYDTVVSNVKKWQEHFKKHNITSTITSITTVDILNVYYLPEIKKAVVDLLGSEPFWNLLVWPNHLSIKSLPQQIKDILIERLQHDPSFDELVDLLNQPHLPLAWNEFLKLTQALDEIRGENFAETFPEFHSIIQQHGTTGIDLDGIYYFKAIAYLARNENFVKTFPDVKKVLNQYGMFGPALTDVDYTKAIAYLEQNKVVIYIGDCAHPAGWYLQQSATSYKDTAIKLTIENCQDIKPGVYYTSLQDMGTQENLLSVLTQADRIVYQEPSFWQDTPRKWWWQLKLGLTSPSKKTIEEILSKVLQTKSIQVVKC